MIEIDCRLIRASFGTTKYCSFFLKGLQCKNKECLYLHSSQKASRIFTKEMMSSKAMYQEQEKIAYNLSEIETTPYERFISARKKPTKRGVFPAPESIYYKKFYFLHTSVYECHSNRQMIQENNPSQEEAAPPSAKPNKFKFINLVSNDSDKTETSKSLDKFSTYDDKLLNQLLDEFQTFNNEEYLLQYNCSLDCLNDESNEHKKRPNDLKTHGTPVYNWSYQKLPNRVVDAYESV